MTTEILLTATIWIGTGWLIYVYWGYGALLKALVGMQRATPLSDDAKPADWPIMTILLTVHNEEGLIQQRLQNLAALDYPPERLQILVASDGSFDRTDELVSRFACEPSLLLIKTDRIGKSAAQNLAIRQASGEIVVLTDAGASFDRACLQAFARAFADPRIGCATANVMFAAAPGSIAHSQGYYWPYELALRDAESRLGILAVASGQAMAFRRALFHEIPPYAGDDCIIPLDVAQQSYRVVHCKSALAYDSMADDSTAEFRARVRMTMRNWTGTWRYPSLLNPLRHPGYAFALWSHKIMRWLGPLALASITSAAIGLAIARSQLLPAIGCAIFWGTGAIGFVFMNRRRSIPVAGTIASFLLANAGFLVGVARALCSQRITFYGPAAKQNNAPDNLP